jgi:hypothetical protein
MLGRVHSNMALDTTTATRLEPWLVGRRIDGVFMVGLVSG